MSPSGRILYDALCRRPQGIERGALREHFRRYAVEHGLGPTWAKTKLSLASRELCRKGIAGEDGPEVFLVRHVFASSLPLQFLEKRAKELGEKLAKWNNGQRVAMLSPSESEGAVSFRQAYEREVEKVALLNELEELLEHVLTAVPEAMDRLYGEPGHCGLKVPPSGARSWAGVLAKPPPNLLARAVRRSFRRALSTYADHELGSTAAARKQVQYALGAPLRRAAPSLASLQGANEVANRRWRWHAIMSRNERRQFALLFGRGELVRQDLNRKRVVEEAILRGVEQALAHRDADPRVESRRRSWLEEQASQARRRLAALGRGKRGGASPTAGALRKAA